MTKREIIIQTKIITMKKNVLLVAVLAIGMLFTNEMYAQKFAKLDKSPMDAAAYPTSYKVSDKMVKVTYSRPQLKGRTVEALAPSGKVWRTGANEAVVISFYKDVTFGGKAVKAGTYSLFTIPGEKEWTIILNSAQNVWGAYTYKESDDVVRVMAPVSASKELIEAFSIAFDGTDNNANMYFGFGNVVVTVPVKG